MSSNSPEIQHMSSVRGELDRRYKANMLARLDDPKHPAAKKADIRACYIYIWGSLPEGYEE